jgi:hypothetical protein
MNQKFRNILRQISQDGFFKIGVYMKKIPDWIVESAKQKIKRDYFNKGEGEHGETLRVVIEDLKYCDLHKMSWVPDRELSEREASCPWCQRDILWDELEEIRDSFLGAIESEEGYAGDFAESPPSIINQMKLWAERWGNVLGIKN